MSIPGIEGVDLTGVGGQIIYWLTYFVVFIVIGVGGYALFHFLSFNIKATEIPLFGSGKKGNMGFGKPKKNRFKWINQRSAWRPLYPLFNRKEIEPFADEYIYPGNHVFAFKIGETLVPGECIIDDKGDKIETSIKPVPYYIRNWQSYSHKKTNQEYASQSFWEQNKFFIMGVITVAICCAVCFATIYISYKFAAPGLADVRSLADAIQGINVIPGK